MKFKRGKTPEEALQIGLSVNYNTGKEYTETVLNNIETITKGHCTKDIILSQLDFFQSPVLNYEARKLIVKFNETIKVGGQAYGIRNRHDDYNIIMDIEYIILKNRIDYIDNKFIITIWN